MYNTSTDDLARVANDLSQIAKKYIDGSQQLDQHVTSLDNATSHLLSGGTEQWVGLSSEAFHGAYLERRSRMQQVSQLLSQSAQHLTQFAQTIENNLPTIRTDQSLMQRPSSDMLSPDDQASILSDESQAQNAIITALATLNSQLEALAEEIRDCPEEQEDNNYYPGYGNGPDNINKSESNINGDDNSEESGNTSEKTYPNTLPERLAEELALAKELGVTPMEVGGQDFDKAINEGPVKWVVTVDGELWIIPKFVNEEEIAHSAISNGGDVIAAGEADIAGSDGQYFGIEITNHSGHYLPDEASLEIGKKAFQSHGIIFP